MRYLGVGIDGQRSKVVVEMGGWGRSQKRAESGGAKLHQIPELAEVWQPGRDNTVALSG